MSGLPVSTFRRLWAVWISVQVELHGCYSVGRLRQLDAYSKNLSTMRLIAVCLLTPLPSLMISLLKESLPLAPPDTGPFNNWVFFLRSWAVTSFIGGSVLVHMNQCIPRLQLSVFYIVFVAGFAAAVSNAVVLAVSVLTVFPLPFGLLLFGPPDILVIAACFAYICGPRWKADPSLWTEVKQQLDVLNAQFSLTFIYPIYIYGLVSCNGIFKVLFIVALPIVKLIIKNRISRTLNTHDDMKPEAVIFTVEAFNALYVSNALHITSSWALTAVIMALDLAQFWSSMLDVVAILNEVRVLMAKIPRESPIANENVLEIVMRILAVDGTWSEARRPSRAGGEERFSALLSEQAIDSARAPLHVNEVAVDNSRNQRYVKRAVFQTSQVVPTCTVTNQDSCKLVQLNIQAIAAEQARSRLDITTVFSLSERALLVHKVTRVFFIAEYLVLMEYTEAVLPVIYSLHDVALYYMHNSAYYPALANLSSAELMSSIGNVMAYALVELISLFMTIFVLKRMLGLSSWRQLAFVLETQAEKIQNKLIVTFLYAMQISLVHLGADFSFKFAWLHSSR